MGMDLSPLQILDSVVDGVFTVDQELRITFFNHAAERITGFTAQQAVGRSCCDIFSTPICQQDCPLRQAVRSGRTIRAFEIEIRTREGQRQTISVNTAPLLDAGGRVAGGVETFREQPAKNPSRASRPMFHGIISANEGMRQIFDTLPNIAQSDAIVLIRGRSGTGKELFASAIHELSPRAGGPLVKVNCGALPEALLESELFGHVKGAFTDARQNRMGRFQAAQGGTILLDEIGDIALPLQVKLLRVLQHREFEPLGSERTVKVDVRVVAATNRDLERLVADGLFREDLYYRLNVILINIPDLAERTEDIHLLVDHFIEQFNHRMGRNLQRVTPEAMAVLMSYPFPGNVRELENVLEHAYIVARGPDVTADDLPPYLTHHRRVPAARPAAGAFGPQPLEERQQLLECLQRNYWSIPRAAKELGMHRTTLWRKVRRHGIQRA